MSLYYEAASLLSGPRASPSASLKTRIYSAPNGSFKSAPKQLYALLLQTRKYSEILVEVVEKSGIIEAEKKLTPLLSVLLLYDHLLSKSGIAAPKGHVLRESIMRHKARLAAEFTRARLKRGYPTKEALKESVEAEWKDSKVRWIRVNTLKTTLEAEQETSFKFFNKVGLSDLTGKGVYIDQNIPSLVGISGSEDVIKWPNYKSGKLILQDKASCFPAYLLNPSVVTGDIIDAFAAPGNKTTHLAALLRDGSRIYAFELSPQRSQILEKMTNLAGASDKISINARSDFLKSNPSDPKFANVTALLLDPSCSGSGIIGREEEDEFDIALPRRASEMKTKTSKPVKQTKEIDYARLKSLSEFQLKVIQHAFTYPHATRITYSTCSIHVEENERVVLGALRSAEAQKYGWRIMSRETQVEGLKSWAKRGIAMTDEDYTKEIQEACIRCEKGGDDSTGGFFVAGFVREIQV
jgi:putative methyltransferase